VSSKSRSFASLTLAALLALASATSVAAAEADKKSTDNEGQSQAELERKLADARKRLDEAAREVANLSISLSDDMVPHARTFGRVIGGPPREPVVYPCLWWSCYHDTPTYGVKTPTSQGRK